ncbi:MAG: ribonuclease H-like domain-containing protein [Ferruginibacter sp.]|nr:ribonuclease H-like domain-containing protein [Ferruginibacter sp.]
MRHIDLSKVMVLDIETASMAPSYDELNEHWKLLWQGKTAYQLPADSTPDDFYKHRAGVMAEFSRVVCISVAVFTRSKDGEGMRLKSIYHEEEKVLLQEWANLVEQKQWIFGGHNIREFDLPFLCRRMIIHGIPIPMSLDFQNKKPWEIQVLDTFQYWRFGDYKNFTSLQLLASALGLPSPKDDINGSMVGELFWEPDEIKRKDNIERIIKYCQKDVITTAQIIRRFRYEQLITEDKIVIT